MGIGIELSPDSQSRRDRVCMRKYLSVLCTLYSVFADWLVANQSLHSTAHECNLCLVGGLVFGSVGELVSE